MMAMPGRTIDGRAIAESNNYVQKDHAAHMLMYIITGSARPALCCIHVQIYNDILVIQNFVLLFSNGNPHFAG